jgi:cell division protein FtsI/penicillin-binding protein 2
MDRYSQGKPLNPMVIIDDYKGDRKTQSLNQVLGYFPDGRPILRLYKGARLPRSSHPKIGRIDLLGAIEQSSNIYFSLLVSDYLENPNALKESAQLFGYGEKTGVDLPAEAKGNVPDDLAQNRNGLYSMAIGQHSLVVTPLQTAAMIAAIANKGDLVRPKVVKEIKGKEGYLDDELLSPSAGFPYEEELSSIGIYFPLFTTAHNFAKQETARETPVKVQRSIFFPKDVYNMITTGMERVIKGERGSARPSGIRALYDHPKAIHDYHDLKNDLWGKTGTAQILYKTTLDVSTEAQMRSHIWFTAVSFPPETRLSPTRFENPELVVVVFQKFGYSGRDAAPIAGQVIQKWRMLKKNPIEQ